MKRTKVILISGIVFFVSLCAGIFTEKETVLSPDKYIDKDYIETVIEQQIEISEVVFNELNALNTSEHPDTVFRSVINDFQAKLNKNGISVYVFRDSSLTFWSDRLMPIQYASVPDGGPVLRKKSNGWYILVSRQDGNYTKVAAILLKRVYGYKNENLPEDVADIFAIPDNTKIDSIPGTGKQIHYGEKHLFSLYFDVNKVKDDAMFNLSAGLYFLAFICLLIVIGLSYIYLADKIRHNNWLLLVLLGDLVLLRFLMMYFDFPAVWLKMDLFSPVHYAESVIYSSLGDMLINVMMLLCFSIVFFRFFRLHVIKIPPFIQAVTATVVYAFVFFLIYYGIHRLHGMIMHSTIPLDFSKLLELSYLSFIGFVGIFLLFVSLLLITDRLLCESRKSIKPKYWLYSACIFVIILIQIYWHIVPAALSIQSFIFIGILIGILVYIRVTRKTYSYYILLSLCIILAALLTCVINDFITKKEKAQARVMAMNLSNERDAGAEYFIKEINEDICEDTKLVDLLEQGDYDKAHDYFYPRYMRGYLERYNVQLTLCNSKDSLIISPNDELMHCQAFFKGMSETYGITLPETDFYFLDNNNGRISYHGQIPVGVNDSLNKTLFIEIESSVQIQGPGYPELLLDQSIMPEKSGNNVSYAKYYENTLISSSGEFNYPEKYNYTQIQTDFFSFESDEMWHLIYHPTKDNVIVVSYKIKNLKTYSIFFTYIFFILFMLMNLVYLTNYIIRHKKLGVFGESLRNRFQSYLLLLLSLSLIVVGVVSISFYIRKYRDKQKDAIEEKMQSVLVELNHKLGEEQSLEEDMKDYLNYLLVKFSNVFYTDINLYGLDGKLMASSRMEIYDRGLVGQRMAPRAYNQIQNNETGYFVQNEKIGKMEYLSAYLPFQNIHGDILAYINLPYFARQSDFSQEISSLTVALLNVYLIMFIFTILIALVTSNQLTRPLRMIQDRLRLMDISKRNRKIRYAGNDEIGSLVQEYNRKVDELAESAEKLARSEREYAWREMAKQIAHEIKNPLTPMKLSVQHLEKAYKENDPDFDQMFDRVSKTLIEQIDSLADIATEFSNFARIRLKQKQRVDLVERIYQIKQLFTGLSATKIIIKNEVDDHAWILADKEQIIRMLNNLIKNALQAIPSGKQGIIRISLSEKNNHFLLSIADNGIGIPDHLHEKIFSPSFTTKTSGMGLGLSIVKGIVDNIEGEIYYRTEKNKGSEFFIEIPKMQY
jgi:two-component system, NtrC family, nitrogen regulation sensor histidine kinase NtrY